eukprot:m.137731 g.137731  ORF g.137731 m.137731 type:complete len:348 (+) comp16609_c2_seq7:800-1843(+)
MRTCVVEVAQLLAATLVLMVHHPAQIALLDELLALFAGRSVCRRVLQLKDLAAAARRVEARRSKADRDRLGRQDLRWRDLDRRVWPDAEDGGPLGSARTHSRERVDDRPDRRAQGKVGARSARCERKVRRPPDRPRGRPHNRNCRIACGSCTSNSAGTSNRAHTCIGAIGDYWADAWRKHGCYGGPHSPSGPGDHRPDAASRRWRRCHRCSRAADNSHAVGPYRCNWRPDQSRCRCSPHRRQRRPADRPNASRGVHRRCSSSSSYTSRTSNARRAGREGGGDEAGAEALARGGGDEDGGGDLAGRQRRASCRSALAALHDVRQAFAAVRVELVVVAVVLALLLVVLL